MERAKSKNSPQPLGTRIVFGINQLSFNTFRLNGISTMTGYLRLSIIAVLGLLSCMCGCSPRARQPLDTLPVHLLSLSAQGKKDVPRQADTKHKWYVKGERLWRHVVLHHSATDVGSASVFDRAHRGRGWDELGYHFVINNGRGGPDGNVEIGSRWKKQKWGAHCGGTPDNEYNEHGIGICIVGDFTSSLPSKAQLASLKELLLFLMRTYKIPVDNVIGHRDAPQTHTACPGDRFHKYLLQTLRPQLVKTVIGKR